MDQGAKSGYQDENWKDNKPPQEYVGNRGGAETGAGMVGCEREMVVRGMEEFPNGAGVGDGAGRASVAGALIGGRLEAGALVGVARRAERGSRALPYNSRRPWASLPATPFRLPPSPGRVSLLLLLPAAQERNEQVCRRLSLALPNPAFAYGTSDAAPTMADPEDLTSTFGVLLIGFILAVVLYGLTFFRAFAARSQRLSLAHLSQKPTSTTRASPRIA